MSAPGAPEAKNGPTPVVNLAGNNPISQFVDPSTMTITNTTLPGHEFYKGQVVIQVTPTFYGSDITITGTGTDNSPVFNDTVGLAYFGAVAGIVQNLCAQGADGTLQPSVP